jgi:peptidoglycan hydrolase CwlO-like protein
MNDIVAVIVNYGIAGIVIYMFYQLMQMLLQKYMNEFASRLQDVELKLADLNNHITDLTRSIVELKEEIRQLRELLLRR